MIPNLLRLMWFGLVFPLFFPPSSPPPPPPSYSSVPALHLVTMVYTILVRTRKCVCLREACRVENSLPNRHSLFLSSLSCLSLSLSLSLSSFSLVSPTLLSKYIYMLHSNWEQFSFQPVCCTELVQHNHIHSIRWPFTHPFVCTTFTFNWPFVHTTGTCTTWRRTLTWSVIGYKSKQTEERTQCQFVCLFNSLAQSFVQIQQFSIVH